MLKFVSAKKWNQGERNRIRYSIFVLFMHQMLRKCFIIIIIIC